MRRIKRFVVYFIITMLLLLPFISGCAEVSTNNDMVARVNGQAVTRQEVDEFIRMVYLYMPDLQEIYSSSEQAVMLESEILWLLIESVVLQQELERLSLKPDEVELERHFRQFREDLINFIYETEEKYLDRLHELQLNEEQLKALPRSTMLRELLFQHVSSTVTEEDARTYVQENPFLLEQPASVYAFRILLESEQEALQVRRLLEQGADFVETGEKYSRDGFIELGQISETDIFDPPFIKAAFQLEPGELSQPVKTPQGYYIILITEKEEASTLDFEQVKAYIMAVVQEEYYEEYFHRLLQDSTIETFIGDK